MGLARVSVRVNKSCPLVRGVACWGAVLAGAALLQLHQQAPQPVGHLVTFLGSRVGHIRMRACMVKKAMGCWRGSKKARR